MTGSLKWPHQLYHSNKSLITAITLSHKKSICQYLRGGTGFDPAAQNN
jgi:hypothetical protein